MKNPPFLKKLITASFFSLFTLSPALAQCTEENLSTCPGACVERCAADDAFFDAHLQECAAITRGHARNPDEYDPAQCETRNEGTGSALDLCLSDARALVANFGGNREAEDFFADAPGCASGTHAFRVMYTCLSGEADAITGIYQPLDAAGYTEMEAPVSYEEENPICKVSFDQISRDKLLASGLTNQSELLMEEFERVSSCRREWETWMNGATERCDETRTGACSTSIDQLIKRMQSGIEPAKAREVAIRSIVDGIEEQLEEIQAAIMMRGIDCPPD